MVPLGHVRATATQTLPHRTARRTLEGSVGTSLLSRAPSCAPRKHANPKKHSSSPRPTLTARSRGLSSVFSPVANISGRELQAGKRGRWGADLPNLRGAQTPRGKNESFASAGHCPGSSTRHAKAVCPPRPPATPPSGSQALHLSKGGHLSHVFSALLEGTQATR